MEEHCPWVILTHCHRELATIHKHQVCDALAPEMLHEAHAVRIETSWPDGDLTRVDWWRLQEEQAAQMVKLRPLLDQGCPVAYFGSTLIPLAMDLGFRVSSWPRVEPFTYDRDASSWQWPGREPGAAPVDVLLEGLPAGRSEEPGDAVIRVSVSQRVDPADTRAWVPAPLAEIDVHLGEKISRTGLRTREDLNRVAARFLEALDAIRDKLRGVRRVHVFAAVPVGLAFRMGQRIQHTVHPPVQTYKFVQGAQPRAYQQALLVNESMHSHVPVAPERIGILFLSAVPHATKRLRNDQELRDIKERLEQGRQRDRFHLVGPHTALRARDLQRVLRRDGTHIVHFSCHGEEGGILVLEDESGNPHRIQPGALRELFRLVNQGGDTPGAQRVQCVVINGCHAAALADLLVQAPAVVPCAIGTHDAVKDDAAVAFADGFYGALADGECSLRAAFDYGRNQVSIIAHGRERSDVFHLAVAAGVDESRPLFGRLP